MLSRPSLLKITSPLLPFLSHTHPIRSSLPTTILHSCSHPSYRPFLTASPFFAMLHLFFSVPFIFRRAQRRTAAKEGKAWAFLVFSCDMLLLMLISYIFFILSWFLFGPLLWWPFSDCFPGRGSFMLDVQDLFEPWWVFSLYFQPWFLWLVTLRRESDLGFGFLGMMVNNNQV